MSNVTVCVRFRPLSLREKQIQGDNVCILPSGPKSFSFKDQREDLVFSFDRVFYQDAAQTDVYELIARPIVQDAVNAINGAIVIYGQTGTGKRYSIEGPDILCCDEHNKGLLPRVVDGIFEYMKLSPETITYDVQLSMVEVYMDKTRDLLDLSKDNIQVEEGNDKELFLYETTKVSIQDTAGALLHLSSGIANKAVGETQMNRSSSRSHYAYIFSIQQESLIDHEVKNGKLVLVDLAGSEKVEKTDAEGKVLEEAETINKSLSALGDVISALTTERMNHIPCRDSKLIDILRDALGGNSRTALLCCCSPSLSNAAESLSTLRFGSRAKLIVRMPPKINNQEAKSTAQLLIESLIQCNICDKLSDTEMECQIAENGNLLEELDPHLTEEAVLPRDDTIIETLSSLQQEVEEFGVQIDMLKTKNSVLEAMLISATCVDELDDKFLAGLDQDEPINLNEAESSISYSMSDFNGQKDVQLASHDVIEFVERNVQLPTDDVVQFNKQLVSTNPIAFNDRENFDDELLIQMLLHLPAQDLQLKVMHLSERFFKITQSLWFVRKHAEHHSHLTSRIIVQYAKPWGLRFTPEKPTIASNMVGYALSRTGFSKVDQQFKDFNVNEDQHIIARSSCNGLILFQATAWNGIDRRLEVLVINPLTGSLFTRENPYASEQDAEDEVSHYGFVSCDTANSTIYKIFYAYREAHGQGLSKFAVLTVGSDEVWREVNNVDEDVRERLNSLRPVSTDGSIHWVLGPNRSGGCITIFCPSNPAAEVLSLDALTEEFSIKPLPTSSSGLAQIVELGGKLGLLWAGESGEVRVWHWVDDVQTWQLNYSFDDPRKLNSLWRTLRNPSCNPVASLDNGRCVILRTAAKLTAFTVEGSAIGAKSMTIMKRPRYLVDYPFRHHDSIATWF